MKKKNCYKNQKRNLQISNHCSTRTRIKQNMKNIFDKHYNKSNYNLIFNCIGINK